MNKLIEIAKGSLMGIANIIPGVSGGTIAVIFRIYDKLIEAINKAFKKPLEALKDTYLLIIGIILGVLIGVFLISYGYEAFPLPTTLIFIGLIFGGIKPIVGIVNKRAVEWPDYLIFMSLFALIILLPLIGGSGGIASGTIYYIMLFVIGFLAAFTMIAPGISGSMVLLVLGYYQHVLDLAKELIESLIQLDFQALVNLILPVGLLGIGAILGAVVTSKLMAYLMEKHEVRFYYGIIGMLFASPFAIMYLLNQTNPLKNIELSHYMVGVILMIGAAYLSYALIKKYEN
ncbi:Integral membrane protein [Paracholeplasma brassicae]|uniref:Integral membrane protein n=1 Tax=Acholeplasma brassicae TaxID=61635 RepID=U4KNJ8_9MOLU|nr:DUF368 domain-containing protein [Paracholeplasma brassicae]CCV65855.1 Integral membrane protein [Paracholeplasma brassicae]